MKILLIEDEQPAAKQLTKMLLELDPTLKIIEVLDSVETSVRWLQNYPMPDAIFMDIQIADGLSFDIFTQVEIDCPVIFTTAFDQYAIKAFRVAAVDYLLKPIEPEELQAALLRLREKTQEKTNDFSKMLDFLQKKPKKERFLIKKGQSFVSIETEDIAYFFAEDGIVQAMLNDGHKYTIENSLEEIEQQLDASIFFRINRKMLLHNKHIQKIQQHFNGRLKLEIAPVFHEEVFVARERVQTFKAWLGG